MEIRENKPTLGAQAWRITRIALWVLAALYVLWAVDYMIVGHTPNGSPLVLGILVYAGVKLRRWRSA